MHIVKANGFVVNLAYSGVCKLVLTHNSSSFSLWRNLKCNPRIRVLTLSQNTNRSRQIVP